MHSMTTPNAVDDEAFRSDILAKIDEESETLLSFLADFNHAVGGRGPDMDTTAPAADVIVDYLAKRHIKTMTIAPEPTRPSIVSIFDEGEGPCLVLNGLITTAGDRPPADGVEDDSIAPCTSGTAALVAAYAYLHSCRSDLFGTVVLEAVSDDDGAGDDGACYHLLHRDERRQLWRGDCMLNSGTGNSGLNASSATHPMAVLLSNNGRVVMGRRPSIPVKFERGHCALWRDVGVPSFSFTVNSEDRPNAVKREDFIRLVKVLTITAWDYVRMGE